MIVHDVAKIGRGYVWKSSRRWSFLYKTLTIITLFPWSTFPTWHHSLVVLRSCSATIPGEGCQAQEGWLRYAPQSDEDKVHRVTAMAFETSVTYSITLHGKQLSGSWKNQNYDRIFAMHPENIRFIDIFRSDWKPVWISGMLLGSLVVTPVQKLPIYTLLFLNNENINSNIGTAFFSFFSCSLSSGRHQGASPRNIFWLGIFSPVKLSILWVICLFRSVVKNFLLGQALFNGM